MLMCTVPSRGATSWCSIFMASTESSTWPASTVSPLLTETDTTVPGIGERTAGSAAPSSRSMAASTRASRVSRVSDFEAAGPALVAEEEFRADARPRIVLPGGAWANRCCRPSSSR